MLGQQQGALGATFILTRAAQAASMIAIIGMTANFISEMVSASMVPPSVIVGTLSIVCIAVLYCAITVILYLDNLLPFLVNAAVDSLFLIAVIVIAVVVGKPLSYTECNGLGNVNDASSAFSFASALSSTLEHNGKVEYGAFVVASKSVCLEMKSIWGLSIALCILFFLSAVSALCLWRRSKQSTQPKGEA